ncbi:hypothetical protein CBR_g54432 [Chara braunii]|uniref:Uncharacterized protein n=1 Tax=Chara braunii TaxID=69332 RepID=A0A388MC41_CHABU|nr:hypothetical protein CBR_g54432 [Chara braunii]|eukprot:GBG92131.1 hypothetical protein CBR_g54432 [Chara braunii]
MPRNCSILEDIPSLRGVFVQSEGDHLKRQHKPGITDMVETRKVDRVMLRMFHYILFLETEEDECVWRHGSSFFRTEGKLLEEYGPQGLTKQVWVEMRKHFQGVVEYVNTCKRTLPHEKESLDDAKKLYDDDRFPKSLEKSVRSILRRTEEEVRDTIRVRGDVRHIKWPDLNRVTSLIPFAFPPSQAHSHATAIREVVRHYVCNLYVLDLCDPTLLTDWREDDFANLQGLLQTLSPTHWALVIFSPSHWELSFLKGMARLSVHHVRTGKWVRNAQKQATVREGNMLVEECDRLYVIFNGEKLGDNTFAVYPASSPTKASLAHGPSPAKHTVAGRSKVVCSSEPSGQAVACFDVAEEERFSRSMWEDAGVTSSQGPAYGEMERNPSRLLGLLENFCKAGQTVFFFGKAHASVMWELLRTGRNIVALEKEAKMIDYLHEFVKARVADTRNACESVQTTSEQNWDPKRDMYWKLSGNKRTHVWDFLFGPGPLGPTDLEYSRRRNLVFAVLNGYHGAPRESVSHFLRRLEHIYFTLAETLTLENYKSQFDEEEPFDADDMEELGDSETFDFECMPLPRVVGQTLLLRQASPVHVGGCLGTQRRLAPRIFQPAVKNGIWVMAIKEADGKWSGLKRLGVGAFKRKARTALVEHLSLMNPERNDRDVDAYAEQKLHELYANNMLEFRAPIYALETAPSRGIHWRMLQPPPAGQHPGGGGGGDEGDGGGGGGDGSQFAGKGMGETSSVEKASDGKGSGRKGSGGKGSGGKGSGGKRRTSGNSQYMETEPHCVGSQDFDIECERHASEGASVDTDSESAGAPGETHALQRGEETRHGPAREDVKWLHARALVIGTSEEILHSRSAAATTREGVVKVGKWTSVQAPVLSDDEDEEEPAVEARVHGDEKGGEPVVEGSEVTVDIRTDPQRKDSDSSPTRCGEEQGGRASVLSTARGMVLHEAIELGDDSATTELGDRASVLSTGREMVLHEPIDLPSDSAATELVSDTVVAEVQNLESSVDVGTVARQEGELLQRAPEHGVRLLMSLPMKPLKAVREKRLSGRSLAASPKKLSSVGLFKRVQMPRLSQRAVRVLKACGIDKEEGLRKDLAASIESVTALSDRSDEDDKRGVLKDPCPKYIAKDTFNKRGYNFSGKRADSS